MTSLAIYFLNVLLYQAWIPYVKKHQSLIRKQLIIIITVMPLLIRSADLAWQVGIMVLGIKILERLDAIPYVPQDIIPSHTIES